MDSVVTLEVLEIGTREWPVAPPLAAEQRAFVQLLPELLRTYRGQYVAILGDRVIDSGPDRVELLTRVYAEHGYRPILCRLVTDQPPPVVRIPSVWLGRPG